MAALHRRAGALSGSQRQSQALRAESTAVHLPCLLSLRTLGQCSVKRPVLQGASVLPGTVASHSRQQRPTALGVQRRPSVRAHSTAAAAAGTGPEKKHGLDVAKIVSLGIMFLCSCFNYTLLQNLKDSLIVTSAGAEVLPFLGSYGVLPGSILFYYYHERLTKALPERFVYYAALVPFLAFYVLFATVIFPLAPVLHPTHLLESWQAMLPGGLVGLASMGVYWTFSLFFVVAELWGGVAISMLFWGLADDVCNIQEAKDIYPALGMIANVGLIVAGATAKFINKLAGDSDLVCLRLTTAVVVVVSGVLLAAKGYVDNKYLAQAHAEAEAAAEKKKKKKRKEISDEGGADASGLAVAFNVLKGSPKVGNLAVLVTAYFVVQKLFDFAWKAQLRLFYPTNVAYQAALADVSQMIGIATILLMATSRFSFEHLGWKGTALISPVAIGVTGTIFFAAAMAAQNPGLIGPQMASLIIPLGALAGVGARVISKAAKYSLFDPAKEMVYITMEKQEKTEGKAAVDLLASYFGKSGASLLTQALVLVFGTLNRSMPFIAASHLLVCVAWTNSTLTLAGLMKHTDTKKPKRPPSDPATTPATSSFSSSSPSTVSVSMAGSGAPWGEQAGAAGAGESTLGAAGVPGAGAELPSVLGDLGRDLSGSVSGTSRNGGAGVNGSVNSSGGGGGRGTSGIPPPPRHKVAHLGVGSGAKGANGEVSLGLPRSPLDSVDDSDALKSMTSETAGDW